MNIKFYLMHLDKQVALVDADITVNMLNIKSFEAIDKYRLPIMLRNLENEEYYKDRYQEVKDKVYFCI